MISGLLKLMRQLSFTGSLVDFEAPFKSYSSIGDDVASREVQRAQFHLAPFLLQQLRET
jgi:hypothetical protein